MDNRDVVLTGQRVTLTPYVKEYVETYHRWMCSPELLELTCSEPLSLEEEYRNQEEWLDSGDKLTFIILRRAAEGSDDEADVPVGDCNLFLLPGNDTEDADDGGAEADAGQTDGGGGAPAVEVEVMIAETSCRRQGLAAEAVSLLMRYGARALTPRPAEFHAKILSKNEGSRRLFEGKLGFEHFKEVPVFEEDHYKLIVGSEAWQRLCGDKDG